MDDLIRRLNAAAEAGIIDELYAVIGENPNVLEEIDKIPFVETPLHKAASAGHLDFAIEIFMLKRSFGRKLNPSGLSPLHLAVPPRLPQDLEEAAAAEAESAAKQKSEIAIRLINIDSELIRVQGKEMMTPLHYAAERNNRDLVAEFLCACPKSMEDLTIQGETALHVALRTNSIETAQVILGWHYKINRKVKMYNLFTVRLFAKATNKDKGVLTWKNKDGDTVLHIAASRNQHQVVEKLIMYRSVNMNDMNLLSKTALDLGETHQNVKAILVGAGALKGSRSSRSLAKFMREEMLYCLPRGLSGELGNETHQNVKAILVGAGALKGSRSSRSLAKFMREEMLYCLPRGLSGELGNAVLVVAGLIATATFQLPLSATTSGGIFKIRDCNSNSTSTSTSTLVINNNTTGMINTTTTPGEIKGCDINLMPEVILFLNSIAFFTSIVVISFTLPAHFVTRLLQFCLLVLTSTYTFMGFSLSPFNGIFFYVCFLPFYTATLFLLRAPKKISTIRIPRYNPCRFFEMRYEMIGW